MKAVKKAGFPKKSSGVLSKNDVLAKSHEMAKGSSKNYSEVQFIV